MGRIPEPKPQTHRKSLTVGHHRAVAGRAGLEFQNGWHAAPVAAHHGRTRSGIAAAERRENLVETVIGIALIVLAALEIWFIVRTVQSNMGRA